LDARLLDVRAGREIVDRAAAKREPAVRLTQSVIEQLGELLEVAAHDEIDIAGRTRALAQAQFHRHPALCRKDAVPVRVDDPGQRPGQHHRGNPEVQAGDRLAGVLLPLRDQLLKARFRLRRLRLARLGRVGHARPTATRSILSSATKASACFSVRSPCSRP